MYLQNTHHCLETVPQYDMLLRIPVELRLKIYGLVFGPCPCRNPNAHYTPKHQIALNMLLVNRQIYAEARKLAFQAHDFNFHRWSGTGVHFCRIFLQRLHRWQMRSIRKLSLKAVESCLVNASSSRQSNWEWLDLCAMLAGEEGPNGAELRELSLTIEGQRVDGSKLLDVDAEWIQLGIRSLKSLRHLEIVLAGDMIERGVAETFKAKLMGILRTAGVVMKSVVRGSVICL